MGRIAAEKMAHTLRMGYATKLIHRAVEQGKECDTASTMSVAQNELAQADGYLVNVFFDITGMLLMGILATVFMFIQNVLLTLVLLIPTFGGWLFMLVDLIKYLIMKKNDKKASVQAAPQYTQTTDVQ